MVVKKFNSYMKHHPSSLLSSSSFSSWALCHHGKTCLNQLLLAKHSLKSNTDIMILRNPVDCFRKLAICSTRVSFESEKSRKQFQL